MNQLFTRLLLLSVVLVGFVMSDTFAQVDGLEGGNANNEPCFAIWDTDEDRDKNNNPLLRRFIDIYIPNVFSASKYRAVIRYYDPLGNLIPMPGAGNNNGVVQDIYVPNSDPDITVTAATNGDVYTFELLSTFSQSLVSYVSLDLFAFHLNSWMPLHTSNNPKWDVNSKSQREICWDKPLPIVKGKGDKGRLGAITKEQAWAYPNPSTGYVRIAPLAQNHQLELYDLQGRLLKSWQFEASTSAYKISIQAFPAGVYYLKRKVGAEQQYQRIQVL